MSKWPIKRSELQRFEELIKVNPLFNHLVRLHKTKKDSLRSRIWKKDKNVYNWKFWYSSTRPARYSWYTYIVVSPSIEDTEKLLFTSDKKIKISLVSIGFCLTFFNYYDKVIKQGIKNQKEEF